MPLFAADFVLDSMQDPLFIKDSQHRWVYANRSFARMLGKETKDFLGKDDSAFFPAAMYQVFWREDDRVIKTGIDSHIEEEVLESNGISRRILTKKSRLEHEGQYYVFGTIRDITDLSRSTRLQHLTELSGGLAHELLTPLTVLDYNLKKARQLMAKNAFDMQVAEGMFKKFEVVQTRLMGTIHGVHSFARQCRHVEPIPYDLSTIIDDVSDMVQPRLEKRRAQLILGPMPAVRLASRGPQISQILVNLIHNAADAVSDLTYRWIKIEASINHGHVEIRIIDAGQGIPSDIAAKLMQPFFSTKTGDEGTGLGLALASRIAQDHDGELSYDASAKHTTFVLRLPILD